MLRSRTVNRNEGVNNNSKDGCKTVKPPPFTSSKFTKLNLHELLAELISETSLSGKNEVDVLKDEPNSKSEILVNSTSTNVINPG